MKHYVHIPLLFLFCLLWRADAQPNTSLNSSVMRQNWIVSEWTGDDSSFAKERRRLEAAPLSQLQAVLHQGHRWGLSSPPKPAMWFSYGTAAYLSTTKWKRDATNDLVRAADWSTRIVSPPTPTYARLQFLLSTRGLPRPELKDIGLRLARRDAKDYDVRYYLCKSLVPDRIPANKALALRLCDEMQSLSPKRPSAYSARGSVYFRCWLARKEEKDRKGALSAYKHYLQLAPATDEFRSQAQRLITMLQKE